jgi:hypothetical protein
MALERFDALLANTPSPLPSHHFSVRPGGGGGLSGSGGYSGVSGSGGHSGTGFNPTAFPTTGQKGDRRGAMKITNFDPSQDYNSLARQHSASRLFEVKTPNSIHIWQNVDILQNWHSHYDTPNYNVGSCLS